MLVIVNPYATTVSDRLKNLVVYALRGRYDVHAVDTEARDHATELCREAAAEGYDVVVAFGGDGTVNEAANGLVGSDTPLFCLPGGRTNVYCRMLGIPTDVVDATEHLLGLADDWHPRRVEVGQVNERYFLFSAGVGLDASVVEQRRRPPSAEDALRRVVLHAGPRSRPSTATTWSIRRGCAAELGAETVDGVTTIVQSAEPYTYFGERPVHMAEGASLDSGDLAGVVLRRASRGRRPGDRLAGAVGPRPRHPSPPRRAVHRPDRGTRHSLDERALPLQVDGDYIGEVARGRFQQRTGGHAGRVLGRPTRSPVLPAGPTGSARG